MGPELAPDKHTDLPRGDLQPRWWEINLEATYLQEIFGETTRDLVFTCAGSYCFCFISCS